jgi:hypothetical protein
VSFIVHLAPVEITIVMDAKSNGGCKIERRRLVAAPFDCCAMLYLALSLYFAL